MMSWRAAKTVRRAIQAGGTSGEIISEERDVFFALAIRLLEETEVERLIGRLTEAEHEQRQAHRLRLRALKAAIGRTSVKAAVSVPPGRNEGGWMFEGCACPRCTPQGGE